MNPILVDVIIALVLALLSAIKKEGTNKTPAFLIGFIIGILPVVNVLGIIIVLFSRQRLPKNAARN